MIIMALRIVCFVELLQLSFRNRKGIFSYQFNPLEVYFHSLYLQNDLRNRPIGQGVI